MTFGFDQKTIAFGSENEYFGWWRKNFPQSWDIHGPCIRWGEPNLNFLASALGELPFDLIYSPAEESFYFSDYLFEGAYRPVSKARIVALAQKVVQDSVKDANLSHLAATGPIFHSAESWVNQAMLILAVEGNFFRGEKGHRRWIEGRFVEPMEKPSVVQFIESKIQPRKGEVLSTPDAYMSYSFFCCEKGLPQVDKTQFKMQFAREVKNRWQVGIRNDLKANGHSFQGWSELAVV
jgi:hypothetical protein